MNILMEIIKPMMPWLVFLVFVLSCIKMTGWAKKRKTAAIAFGLVVQMFLPDPKAQVTIESVVERKQEVKKQRDGNAEPNENEDKGELE